MESKKFLNTQGKGVPKVPKGAFGTFVTSPPRTFQKNYWLNRLKGKADAAKAVAATASDNGDQKIAKASFSDIPQDPIDQGQARQPQCPQLPKGHPGYSKTYIAGDNVRNPRNGATAEVLAAIGNQLKVAWNGGLEVWVDAADVEAKS